MFCEEKAWKSVAMLSVLNSIGPSMKIFTEANVTSTGRIYLETSDLVFDPLARHKLPGWDGYGKRNCPSPYKINFNGKLYRVRFTCISNVASHWFTVGKRTIYIS